MSGSFHLRFRAILVAAAVAATAGLASAAKLPDWAADIARGAPEVGAEEHEDDWRVLLAETHTVVRPDGVLEIRRRIACQALRDNVSAAGVARHHYVEGAKFRSEAAWHLSANGKATKSREAPVDVLASGSFLTDKKARYVPVHGVRKGSLVFFQYEVVEFPAVLTMIIPFYRGRELMRVRYEIETPPGWDVRHDWLRSDGPDPETEGDRRTWEVRGTDESHDEQPLGESVGSATPWLVLAIVPPPGAYAGDAKVAGDWKQLAQWYMGVVEQRHAVTPEIQAVAVGLLGDEEDPYERIRVTGIYVRDGVRYVARQIGTGNYQPRPAAQVLREKLGDCKDKGTLLRSLLEADRIDSWPVLISATAESTVSPDVPAPQSFDHFVIAVALPEKGDVPDFLRPAVIEPYGLGRMLIVDATDDSNSIGSLPASLAGKRALLVAGENSRIVLMPEPDPAVHRIERSTSMLLRGDGGVRIEEQVVRVGHPASDARVVWRESSADYRTHVEGVIRHEWTGATVDDFHVEPETRAGEFIETFRYDAESPAIGSILSLFPFALDDLSRVPLGRRKGPVVYPFPLTLRQESKIIGVGEDTALPAPRELSGEGWSVTTSLERKADILHGSWQLTLNRTRFEPQDFDELRAFWAAARQAASAAIRHDPEVGP